MSSTEPDEPCSAVFYKLARHAPTIAVDSASAMVRPPCLRSRVIASAPSRPIPVIRTPTNCVASYCSSALVTIRSTLGCQG